MTKKPGKTARWRAVWQLIKPYWRSEEKWKAWSMLAAIIILSLGSVYLSVQFNEWNRVFYDALQNKNFPVFKQQLFKFTWLALIFIVVSIYKVYLTQGLQMNWRRWMTNEYMDKWLTNHAYYYTEHQHQVDNPDQRIASDLSALTSGTLSLSLGLLSSLVTLFSFVTILWSVSGPISFMLGSHAITIPGYMLWFALLYALVGSVIIGFIGRPLVKLSFNQEWFEANFRFGLIRIRENSDAIALYHGEKSEKKQLADNFEAIRSNWWSSMRTTRRLNFASSFYGQFAIIFPILVAAPRYFSGAIQMGLLMQISSAFGQVQDSLSWFINAFNDLASWKACVNRLAGFNAAIDQVNTQPRNILLGDAKDDDLQLNNLTVTLPNGNPLFSSVSASLATGARVLVAGPSGCGKSTLLRAIAGVWPYGTGEINTAANKKQLFLPQRSYIPIGSLREALTYPEESSLEYTDERLCEVLEWCNLSYLQPVLDHYSNWSQRLSPGEQQRLAFARAMLIKPEILYLDEATSALDDETEQRMYSLLLEKLPQTTVLSVAHRNSVAKYHEQCWRFQLQDDGQCSLMRSRLHEDTLPA
ncbi:ABC transporter ATP-binding protein/permease [Rouxiella badensis]|jgi:putative ATP-binding cassette transporter|uniref:ABC transporter ATP-binding protein n=1 Tax=Rouxiella badensis TaxID=1646377 RepID=A0A1X0WF10_9GAMM|nr:ABC transporter ATP-binding protein/permease [Rouxiella badensis]MCC3703780.1 ABC transporter ATP-binding protein/permease [Rouxiella badensis]MCC3719808.1 ABC transporter ATP-binding protein/permease [Rouxiella badensis]MCC3729340.1 ABC transporter ATP-binding protein/permease [Rouxiella badensis]MCC3734756.1 ABC transporter ATP-binding protein/permease [Rouxiella badensis]MCC3741507.1 ABC transporter ATP-binding protein/permease [Rouxiella badensis]